MFFAIVVPKSDDSISNLIIDKVTVYLPSNLHVLYIASEENIAGSVKDRLVPMIIDTGFEIPVRAYQQYYSNIEDMIDPIQNRKLMTLRSKLVYAVSENLAPEKFYFRLETPINDDVTRRSYIYKLYYEDIPCYTLTNDTLLQNFDLARSEKIGPLISSTYSLELEGIPRWYSREIFRDIVDLGQFPMKDKIVITGGSTREIYLFYREEVNITEDIINNLIIEIRGSIFAAKNLKIFPRNTPEEFIKSRRLVITNNGQWSLPYIIPSNINIFTPLLRYCFDLKSLDELFWFLMYMMICPTYFFIEPELSVCLGSEKIKVCYSTKYLPDYLRVLSASRVRSLGDDEVKILYPSHLSLEELNQQLTDKTSVYFYDNKNNEKAVLIHSKIDIPEIDRSMPLNYSLDERINQDIDPTLV